MGTAPLSPERGGSDHPQHPGAGRSGGRPAARPLWWSGRSSGGRGSGEADRGL